MNWVCAYSSAYYPKKRGGHIENIHLHRCKHKTVKLKLTLTLTLTDNRYRRRRCPDPNARIQKTEELQINTENTNLRLRKYERCIFLILPKQGFLYCVTTTLHLHNSYSYTLCHLHQWITSKMDYNDYGIHRFTSGTDRSVLGLSWPWPGLMTW